MKKGTVYITAGLTTIFSIVLEISLNNSYERHFDGYHLFFGLSAIFAFIMLNAAWKRGQNPNIPFYKVLLFSLGGLFSALVAEIFILGIADIEFDAIAKVLLLLSPVATASMIGHLTRKGSFSTTIRTLINGIPGFLFIFVILCLMVREGYSFRDYLYDIIPLVYIALVTLLPAYAEAQIDPAERRKVQWNCWKLIFLLFITVGLKYFSVGSCFDDYCETIFDTLFHVLFPLFLWKWRQWLLNRKFKPVAQTVLYFAGASLLTVLQSGGLYPLMYAFYPKTHADWLLIGTIVALDVYWQKPAGSAAAGATGSVILTFGNVGLLFATNERVREIFYDLGGPAVNIDLSTRADWLGYRVNMIKAYISGDFSSLYDIYKDAFQEKFIWIVDSTTPPYVFPLTVAILALTVLTAILLVRYAENRDVAKIVALSIVLQTAISFAEHVSLVYIAIDFAFSGYFIADYILLYRLLNPRTERIPSALNTLWGRI